MAPQLKNALAFNLAAGATAIIPHNLNNGQIDLVPDIVFVPSTDLDVSADAQAVTLVNRSGAPLDGAVLVESWHTIERAFGAASNTALAPQPYIVVSPEGGNQPPQPVFTNTEVEIYARLSGSDTTGDGTLAKPYRTFKRAIRDVPSIIPSGTIYKVDITNLGTEDLGTQYEFPIFIGSEGIGNFDFAEPYFYYYGTVNVVADPKVATLASGPTSITLANVNAVQGVGDSFTAALGIVTLTDAAGLFTVDMVGKVIAVAGATTPENNGQFTVASFIGPTQITYANAVGVTQAYAGAWTVYKGVTKPTASTGLLKITVAGAGWTPGDLVGKFCISAGSPTEHSVIWKNTATEIWLTTPTTPTFPLTIMECSAGFEARKDPNDLHRAAVNITNTQVMLGGIKVRSLSAGAGNFGGWSLQIAGNTPPTSIQLCDIKGGGLEGISWVRTRQCYLKDTLFLMAPLVATQTFFDGSIEVVPAGPRITVWGARGLDSMLKQSVVKGTTPVHFRDLFDNFRSGVVGILELLNVQILDTVVEFPPADFAANDGIYWTGGRLYLTNVDISRSAPGTGNALTVNGNGAWAELSNVSGSNYALGCDTQDGGLVVLRGPVSLTGTAGNVKVGSTAVAVWPAAIYPAAGSNYLDLAGAAAQGARVVRKA
jgi:hypothetical protein